MRAEGRTAWNDEDRARMVAEFNRLCPDLDEMPLRDLLTHAAKRRVAEGRSKPKDLAPCLNCGRLLGARERRKPCPECQARNPR